MLRAAAGLLLTLTPLSIRHDSAIASAVLGGLAGLFFLFALRTGSRFLTLVEVTADGISWAPIGSWALPLPGFRPVKIAWAGIDKVSLRFFSTKRDRSEGWMVLSLSARGQRVKLESTLEGFLAIASRSAAAADANNVELSESTVQNFRSLGMVVGRGQR